METITPLLDVANEYPYFSSATIILGCAALARLAGSPTRPPLPPGPKGYPIIGNLFDLPPNHAWEKFGELGKQYGSLPFPRTLARMCPD